MMLAPILAYAGLTALCLAMDRHHRQVWQRVPAPGLRIGLRVLGSSLLAAAFTACVDTAGASIGSVSWFGVLSAAGLLLVFLLPYAPRFAAGLSLLAAPATLLALVA